MKSPRFDARSGILRNIFSPENLEKVWKEKVRTSMREQYINDGIENFDFHINRKKECRNLSRLILKGDYVPDKAQRILVEKSKGLCRQLVIPAARDALVLQCLSDSLYKNIKDKAPTKQAFFEPKDHRFSLTSLTSSGSGYGTFASWINFQRALFNFSKERNFVVVTDISNYYDSISYTHLRNVISPIAGVEECVLDMLIYVLGSLLWQPDYMPVVEIGLPQINLDAPRLLAHCFLYELDAFLASDANRDFVRFMDDIDIGVDSLADAKKVLKSIDLVLQTRQVRLNSGKTLILKQSDALRHFRVRENARLDKLKARVERKRNAGANTKLERRLIQLRISRGLANGAFDDGNGEKVLKRWIGLAATVDAAIQPKQLQRLFLLRPAIRGAICAYIRRFDLTPGRAEALAIVANSGLIVDDAALVDLANHLVETAVTTTHKRQTYISSIISSLDTSSHYGLYCKLWLQSKYDTRENLLDTIKSSRDVWVLHDRIGRIIGSFVPLFISAPEWTEYLKEISDSRNHGIRDAYKFHINLSSNAEVFSSMFPALSNPNKSRGTGITHAKFLALLSALRNSNVPPAQIDTLRSKNAAAWRDIYYRRQARRLGISVAP